MFVEAFDAVYIINLRRRSDRRAEMIQQLRRVGLDGDPRVQFYEAAEPADRGCFSLPGAHGCYLSHLAIFEAEAGTGRSVLILEDDCDFRSHASTFQLPIEWDIFYGGFQAANPDDLPNSNIIGSHCMGYSSRAVDLAATYLRNLLDPSFPPDQAAAADLTFQPDVRPPLDGAIVWFRRAYPELRTIFADISRQRPSRSDIGAPGFLDRHLPETMSVFRKAKQWLR